MQSTLTAKIKDEHFQFLVQGSILIFTYCKECANNKIGKPYKDKVLEGEF